MGYLPDGEVKVWRKMFDFWRDNYDDWPYVSHQRFYDLVWKTFPGQDKFNAKGVTEALGRSKQHPVKVFELGGWTGNLARQMFEQHGERIGAWNNFEICQPAAREGFRHERYLAVSPVRWVWERALTHQIRYDVAILSHVIEHMSFKHFAELLRVLADVPVLYIQTPEFLGDEPHITGWMGTMSTHKLEVGWDDLYGLLDVIGYEEVWKEGEARIFTK